MADDGHIQLVLEQLHAELGDLLKKRRARMLSPGPCAVPSDNAWDITRVADSIGKLSEATRW